ncbi:MAG: glycosyltransferase family 4 protein, partial [Planctomycetaceae bacterium]
MHVVHVITRLIIGGAQENTLLNVEDQHRDYGDRVALVTGPGLGPEGSLEQRAAQGGFTFRVLPELRRNLHPLRDLAAYRALVKLLREMKPDLVHTHSSKAGILGRAAAAKLGIPAVHTIHGAAFHVGQHPLAHWLYRRAERWAAKRCERIISVCDAMTDQYVAAGIAPRDKFVTIYSGMEVEPFLHPPRDPQSVRQELGITSDQVVIGKVARLFHLKGHEAILNVAQAVVARNSRVRFLFVGDGILKAEIQQRIAQMGLTEHFVFTGLVPPSRIPELISAMDLVVHTSLWEGLARVLPQGLISGKPVVSYDVDGAREVVIPGETGFLIPVHDRAKLTEALIELADDPALRQRMGQTGREQFTGQFRHQEMTRRIREVY